MKVGIVGFGKMGMLHGALLNKIDGMEVAAITDSSRVIINAIRSLLPNIGHFMSYEKMIDHAGIDAVVITTPTFSHVPIALKAIKKGLHFFMEKPLGNTLSNAFVLEKALKGRPLVSMVGFHMRYIPTFVKGKELLTRNAIGNVREISSEIYVSDIFSPQKGWRYDPSVSGGGIVIDYTIHLLDILHWYFGEVTTVKAKVKSVYSKLVEDEVKAEFGFRNGLSASIISSWSIPGYRLPYCALKITGDNGSMTVNDHSVTVTDKNGSIAQRHTVADLYSGYYFDIAGCCYSLQMEAFARAIISKKHSSNILDAVYAQRLVDAIYSSSSRGSAVAFAGGPNEAS
jgi:predicted dehydrogenase